MSSDPETAALRGASSTAAAGAALERELGDLGLPCRVEPRDRLAVVHAAPATAEKLAHAAGRQAALHLAARHGFTHVALELPAAEALPGPETRAPLPGA